MFRGRGAHLELKIYERGHTFSIVKGSYLFKIIVWGVQGTPTYFYEIIVILICFKPYFDCQEPQ